MEETVESKLLRAIKTFEGPLIGGQSPAWFTVEELSAASGVQLNTVGTVVCGLAGSAKLAKRPFPGNGRIKQYSRPVGYHIYTGFCKGCGLPFARIGKHGSGFSNCSEKCRDARRNTSMVAKEVQTGGDLAHLTYRTKQKGKCIQDLPWGSGRCAKYAQCLSENFTSCTGWEKRKQHHYSYQAIDITRQAIYVR
jgi:hypothetical protein